MANTKYPSACWALFLYWLQERKKKIFIVATANRVQSLPPELMRAGRWDRAFFIDLPSVAERQKIFEIHLAKQKANIAAFDMPTLLRTTEDTPGQRLNRPSLTRCIWRTLRTKSSTMKRWWMRSLALPRPVKLAEKTSTRFAVCGIKASIRPITSMFKSRMALDENSPSRTKRLTLSCRNTA